MIASPYARRGIVDNSYYTQLNVVKTIEQILGIAPMNQEDRAAWPMYNAFTSQPDFTPYDVVPNQIPLTQGLTTTSSSPNVPSSAKAAPLFVPASAAQQGVPQAERAIYEDWVIWSRAPVRRLARHPGLRQPGPAQPAGLVQRARLEGALPGRQEDSRAGSGARAQPALGLPG